MPVIAVVAAIGASAFAASSVAAVGLTVITALEITAAVGATLGAIGSITKNKALSTAGLVIGAIGAVGGLAAGAGLLGEAAASNAPLFGSAPAASTAEAASAGTIDAMSGIDTGVGDAVPAAAESGAEVAAPAAGSVAANTADPGAALAGPAGGVPQGTEMAAQDAEVLQASMKVAQEGGTNSVGLVADAGKADPAAGGFMNTNPSADLLNADITPGTPVPPQPPANLGTVDPTSGQIITKGLDAAGEEISLPSDSLFGGKLDGLMAFADKHPVMAMGALQSAGSLITGMTSTLTPAQVAAYEAQGAANDAAAALTRQQTANLAMPKAAAHSAPVTGAPQELVPGATQRAAAASQGFINQAPKVTGVAA